MSDLYAVERLKRGDLNGLATLVKRHQARAVRAAYAITQDRQSAEDVVQIAFINLRRTIRTFDTRRPFAPWFFKTVIHAAVRAAKQGQRTLSLNAVIDDESGETFEDLLPDIAALPIERVEQSNVRSIVLAALDQLTPEQRAVIVMRYYLELETDEISEQLASPPATIRWRLHNALKRLRGLLPALNKE
jgi:RNA polymerase sigma-70 factor (ECF subfamily)